jgi:hypothetical protein
VDSIHGIAGTMKKVVAQLEIFLLVGKSRHGREDGAVDHSGEEVEQEKEKSHSFEDLSGRFPEKSSGLEQVS